MKRSDLIELIESTVQKAIKEYKTIRIIESNILNELVFNLNDTYPIDEKESNKTTKCFYDDKGRLNVMNLKNTDINGSKEIKFYWVDIQDNKQIPTYSAIPNSTPKTLNTYLKLCIDYFLNMGDKFVLQPTDKTRLRLYRIALNKLLDMNKWEMSIWDDKIFLKRIK